MPESFWDLLLWGSLGLGAVAMVMGVATDDGDPSAKREQQLQRRLASYPPSARAVVIRGRPVAGWKPALCIILSVGLALGLPKLQTQGTLALICERLGATQTSHLLFLLVFPGVPILMFLGIAPLIFQSIRILRGGYAPPLDSAPTQDTIAVAGWRATLRAVAGLVVMLLLASFTGYLAYDMRQTFTSNNANLNIAPKCLPSPSSKGGPAP